MEDVVSGIVGALEVTNNGLVKVETRNHEYTAIKKVKPGTKTVVLPTLFLELILAKPPPIARTTRPHYTHSCTTR
jgi:hypothetical protein